MTCKTGQNICVSVRPYDVNIFKNTRLRYRWAMSVKLGMYILWVSDKTSRKWSFEFRPLHCAGEMTHPSAVLIMPPPHRGGRGIRWSSASVVRPSDVAYIGSTSKTKRPRKTKLCTGVPQVKCDSHTDFKVKRSKVKVTGRGHIVAAT